MTQKTTGRTSAPKNASGTAPDDTRFTGQELETLPGAKDALNLLDEVVEATGGQKRDGQRTMAAHVAQALELQRHLLVQAGTGTGKSLGYLVPALARVGESDQPIVVALVREDVASELSEYVLEGDLLEVLEEELAEAHALAEATASVSEQPSTSEAL